MLFQMRNFASQFLLVCVLHGLLKSSGKMLLGSIIFKTRINISEAQQIRKSGQTKFNKLEVTTHLVFSI